MAKAVQTNSQSKTVETIMSLAETALKFHGDEKVTLASVARTCGRSSKLLRIADLDERLSCENAATLQPASSVV
jgi:hypothetical protein